MKRKTALPIPTVDVRLMPADQRHSGVFVNQRVVASHVGQFAMELFRQEMMAVVPDETGKTNPDGSQFQRRTSVNESIVRSCVGAEALFMELIRRGWLVTSPETDDLMKQDYNMTWGLHPRTGTDDG